MLYSVGKYRLVIANLLDGGFLYLKVLFIISGLFDSGGAERVLTLLANYWAENGHQVIIANFDDGTRPPYYPLAGQVKRVPLDLMRYSPHVPATIKNNLSRLRKLNQYIKSTNPDIVISFLTNTNITTLMASTNTKVPIIVSERNHPAYSSIDPVRKRLRRWLYPRAAAVVCQTRGILNYYGQALKHNGVIIPNPVLPADPSPPPPEILLPDGHLLLAAGNMSKAKVYQKGFDLLIPVFNNLARKHQDWHLLILGEGNHRKVLQNKVDELNLSERIHLPGNVNNIQAIYNKADLFILPSRYEGFPNVLCEAMASGLPAVSFDCPTGPNEIIRDKIDGILVPLQDTIKLKESLDQLMSSKSTRQRMGKKAGEITKRFSIDKIIGKWEKVINDVQNSP